MLKKLRFFIGLLFIFLPAFIFVGTKDVKAAEEMGKFEIKGAFEEVDRGAILDRVNQIRREAYEQGLVKDYVPIKWSEDMEEISRIRAAELSLSAGHTRPNGQRPFMKTKNGTFHSAENLAWNLNGAMVAIEQFYEEKAIMVDALKKGIDPNSIFGQIGHYKSLINPEYKSMALAAFLPEGGLYYQIANEFSPDLEPDGMEKKAYPSSVIVEGPLAMIRSLEIKTDRKVDINKEFKLDVRAKVEMLETTGLERSKTFKVGLLSAYEIGSLPEGLRKTEGGLIADKPGRYEFNISIQGKNYPVKIKAIDKSARVEKTLVRISGARREDVAADLALRYFSDAKSLLLVNDMTFGDAISASNLSKGRMPILYSKKDRLPEASARAINSINPEKIIMVGGPNSLSDQLENQLRSENRQVERVDGLDRYDVNNRTILGEGGPLYLVKGTIFSDALLAAPLAAINQGNVVLTMTDLVPEILYKRIFMGGLGSSWTIVGGPNSISDRLMANLSNLSTCPGITRITGEDRYELSAELADKIESEDAILVSGEVFSDAMVAAPLAQKLGAPILLTGSRLINDRVLQNFKARNNVYILGGHNSVSAGVEAKLKLVMQEDSDD